MRSKLIFLFPFLLNLVACDPEHRKKCEWYLMPDTTPERVVDEGFIPVCARNLVINRENCRLQMRFDEAKTAYGKKFRYTDLKLVAAINSHNIKSIKYCENH